MDVLPRVSLRPPSAPTSRTRSVGFANASQTESIMGGSSVRTRFREPRIRKHTLSAVPLRADDCDVMVSLMQKLQPVFPVRPKRDKSVDDSDDGETDGQVYMRSLATALDEAVTKRRKQHAKTQADAKEAAAAKVPPGRSSVQSAPAAAGRGAMDAWVEEEEEILPVTRSGEAFCTSRSLVNAVNRGRFPRDANAGISEAIGKWAEVNKQKQEKKNSKVERKYDDSDKEEEKEEVAGGGNSSGSSVLSQKFLRIYPTLLDRLKYEPVRSWRLAHNLTHKPKPPLGSNTGRRDPDIPVDSMIVEKWRHRFDYVNYEEQFELEKSLATRDICRCMVVRHETSTSGEPPLLAMANMFKTRRDRYGLCNRQAPPSTGDEFVWNTVWMQRANEIALEKEKQHLIKAIQSFELRVVAASLSREAVDKLQMNLIKLLKEWPCHYRERHVFTKINFIEWIRARNKLPPSVGTGDPHSASLAECMASRAEATFVEYVLSILPDENGAPHTRRPVTAQ